jgi:hypothetical protein
MQRPTSVPEYRPTRLATLQQEIRYLQEKRQQVETDPSLDANRRAIEVGYYNWILRWLQERVARLKVDFRCAGGSP